MPPFFKRSKHGENRIENAGRWPIRLTHFYLTDDYDFPATNYPEFFYIREGGFFHETKSGKQSIREGYSMVIHPGHQHSISNSENVVLSRIRFLPEWFTKEFYAIVGMPDVAIENVVLHNVEIHYPGGANPYYAKVGLDELDKVLEEGDRIFS